jgi:hypothetical protein
MSDCDGMPRRYHAMLFPIGPQLDEVEALRRAWDPAMAAEIPAHITLVYPVEHPGVEALRERVKGISGRERAFRVCLGDFFAPSRHLTRAVCTSTFETTTGDLLRSARKPPRRRSIRSNFRPT